MPEAGLPWIPKPDVLTFEEIATVVRGAASVGVRAIRLTGGEPLIRRDLVDLVRMIKAIGGIEDLSLSTNALMLGEMARPLRDAGLDRVNISLDTLREDRFFAIARRPGLDRVLAGIDAALAAGLAPVKLNCVVMRGQNDDELEAFAALTRERAVHVRFIEVMPVAENAALQRDAWLSSDDVLARLAALGELLPARNPSGNGPARTFAYAGAPGTVGVISPLAHDYCERCNRVRLSADGHLRLCLFGDNDIDLRTPLRAAASAEEAEAAIVARLRAAMHVKPERHHLALGETASAMRAFSEIGG